MYIIPLLAGYLLDRILGDPSWIPHPVVGFGKLIAKGEKTLNKGNHRLLKGAVLSIGLIAAVYIVSWYFLDILKQVAGETVFLLVSTILVFLCLTYNYLLSLFGVVSPFLMNIIYHYFEELSTHFFKFC